MPRTSSSCAVEMGRFSRSSVFLDGEEPANRAREDRQLRVKAGGHTLQIHHAGLTTNTERTSSDTSEDTLKCGRIT